MISNPANHYSYTVCTHLIEAGTVNRSIVSPQCDLNPSRPRRGYSLVTRRVGLSTGKWTGISGFDFCKESVMLAGSFFGNFLQYFSDRSRNTSLK
jgi:hypothetical protein